MKVLIVAFQWPSYAKGGVALSAKMHAELLLEKKFDVSICGSSPLIKKEEINASEKIHVDASGSGSLYSPSRVNKDEFKKIIQKNKPDFVVVEAWHTSIGDTAIKISYDLSIPVLMISHGTSLSPFSFSLREITRSLLWLYHKHFIFPSLLKRTTVVACLSTKSTRSNRFYDLHLLKKFNRKCVKLTNTPVNIDACSKGYVDRNNTVVIIGYFSRIKAQLRAVELASLLSKSDINFIFIGKKSGSYYKKCLSKCKSSNVKFYNDEEVHIASQIAQAKLVLSVSITEVLPLNLLEAMALGTPFLATDVGLNRELLSGIVQPYNKYIFSEIILKVIYEKNFWNSLSDNGFRNYKDNHSKGIVADQLYMCMNRLSKEK
jgi:glycosyltransferase involved in cell wall biosynthesis